MGILSEFVIPPVFKDLVIIECYRGLNNNPEMPQIILGALKLCRISNLVRLLDYCFKAIEFGAALPRSPKSNSLLNDLIDYCF